LWSAEPKLWLCLGIMAFPGKHLAFVHHGIFPDEPGFEPSAAYESGGLCSIHLDNTLGAGSPPRYRIVSPNSVGAVFRPSGSLTTILRRGKHSLKYRPLSANPYQRKCRFENCPSRRTGDHQRGRDSASQSP
jgi:hypothetical protein